MAGELKIAVPDVSKPGTVPADATSRPVIGQRTVVADPMMNAEPKPEIAAPAAPAASGGSMKSRLTPTSTAEEVTKSAEEDADKESAEKPVEGKTEEVDKNVRLADLIESGEYNVSIKQKKATASAANTISIILLVVVLLAAAAYVLIDMNIVDVNVSLPIEFFK